jgi:hypothetical protein
MKLDSDKGRAIEKVATPAYTIFLNCVGFKEPESAAKEPFLRATQGEERCLD